MHFLKYSYVLEFCIFLVKKLLMQHFRTKHVTTNQNHFICLLIFSVLNPFSVRGPIYRPPLSLRRMREADVSAHFFQALQ